MWPASFAIPYLLTAPLPPSIALRPVPVSADDPAACRVVDHACFVPARVVARNGSNRTLLVDELHVTLSPRSGISRPFDPPLPIPPFGEVTLPDLFAFHVEAGHSVSVWFHSEGEGPRRHLSGTASTGSPAAAGEARRAACRRCNAGHEELCDCRTHDSGQRCTEPSQCQGVCLFDRFEKIPEPPCPALARCGISAPIGFRVGHCSEFKTPIGCPDVLEADDSAARPIPLPAGLTRRCFDEATLIKPDATGSSRRR